MPSLAVARIKQLDCNLAAVIGRHDLVHLSCLCGGSRARRKCLLSPWARSFASFGEFDGFEQELIEIVVSMGINLANKADKCKSGGDARSAKFQSGRGKSVMTRVMTSCEKPNSWVRFPMVRPTALSGPGRA